jgi:hypothetical protein
MDFDLNVRLRRRAFARTARRQVEADHPRPPQRRPVAVWRAQAAHPIALLGMDGTARAQLVANRFEQELGFKKAVAYPIHSERRGGRVMYHMIHATDHAEAFSLMVRAYRKISGRPDIEVKEEQLDLLEGRLSISGSLPVRHARAREGPVFRKCCGGTHQVDERHDHSITRDAAEDRNFHRYRHLLGVLFGLMCATANRVLINRKTSEIAWYSLPSPRRSSPQSAAVSENARENPLVCLDCCGGCRRGSAEAALHHLREIMGKLKLTVNERGRTPWALAAGCSGLR